jgi:hypothetical protein
MGLLRRRVRKHVTKPLKRRVRKQARAVVHHATTRQCPQCQRRVHPFHTCAPKSDFRQRKAAAEREAKRRARAARKRKAAEKRRELRKATRQRQAARRKEAAAERRARERARKQAASRRPAKPRSRRGDSHEPGTCGDRDCQKYGCKAYWQGMEDCPGPHEGG